MFNQTSLVRIMCFTVSCLVCSLATAQTVEWTRQLGTTAADISWGVSADGLGNVFISGDTRGVLDGTNSGGMDAFVSKYDAGGNLHWTRQLGTTGNDSASGISADGLGNVFISGTTHGTLAGSSAGGADAFVSKYDADGNVAWTRQLGTTSDDFSYDVSADRLGNVFISGYTEGGALDGTSAGGRDAFVSKYDADGNLHWTRQLGTTTHDRASSASADGLGNVFISGDTYGTLAGIKAGYADAFVSKYDADGNVAWTRQLGTTSDDFSSGVSADRQGNVFISGKTSGSLDGINAGYTDAFVSKYDASGNLAWTRQLGTTDWDISDGVSADGQGNVFISGKTRGTLAGSSAGGTDVFVSKFDADGNLAWTRQLGTPSYDASYDVSTDGQGNVFISGHTAGALDGTNAGGADAFVTKVHDVPEPSTLILLLSGALGLLLHTRRKRR